MLTQKTVLASGGTPTTIAETATQYDAFGNVLRQTESRPLAGGLPAASRTVTNTYDGISRLTQESILQGGTTTATDWKYDAAGNRLSQIRSTGGTVSSTEVYDYTTTRFGAGELPENFSNGAAVSGELSNYRPNQLRKITRTGGAGGAVYFGYDKNGNRVRKWDTANSRTPQTIYVWDKHNRLILAYTMDAPASDSLRWEVWQFGYDSRSRRIVRKYSTGNIGDDYPMEMESFSGGTSVSRWNATGTPNAPVRSNLRVEMIRGSDFGGGVGGVLYTIEPPATTGRSETPLFYEYGARGDVTGHSDASGAPVFRAVYKAFGDHTDSGSAGPNRQRASTKEEESELGLLNEGYRWRDIQTGTFLSRDPAGFVDGPNLYSYVRQNPWSKFDPEGLWGWNESNGGIIDAAWNWTRDTGKGLISLAQDADPVHVALHPQATMQRNLQRAEGVVRIVVGAEAAKIPGLSNFIPGQRAFEAKFANDFTGGEGDSLAYRATYTALNIGSFFIGAGEAKAGTLVKAEAGAGTAAKLEASAGLRPPPLPEVPVPPASVVGAEANAAATGAETAGTGTLHYWDLATGPHFSVETAGIEAIHTEQVLTEANTTMRSVEGILTPDASMQFNLTNINAAQELQLSRLGADLGVYNRLSNSCLTNARDILNAGGASLPSSNLRLAMWAKETFGF